MWTICQRLSQSRGTGSVGSPDKREFELEFCPDISRNSVDKGQRAIRKEGRRKGAGGWPIEERGKGKRNPACPQRSSEEGSGGRWPDTQTIRHFCKAFHLRAVF